jgi:hypothetical protein
MPRKRFLWRIPANLMEAKEETKEISLEEVKAAS